MRICANCGHMGCQHVGPEGQTEQGICYGDYLGGPCGARCAGWRLLGELTPGDTVRLLWNGYPGISKSLSNELATVERVLRTGAILVSPWSEVGSVRRAGGGQWRPLFGPELAKLEGASSRYRAPSLEALEA